MLAEVPETKLLVLRFELSEFLSTEPINKVNQQKDLGIINSQVLNWGNYLSVKSSKTQKLYFLLRDTVPWNTPSSLKFNIYSSTVLSVIIYASPMRLAKFCFLKKMDSFQKHCFKWIFWSSKPTCGKQFIKFHHLPASLLLAMRILFFFLDTLENKNLFVPYNYTAFLSNEVNLQEKNSKSLEADCHPTPSRNSLFARAVASFNCRYRHVFINFSDPTNKSILKKFVFAEAFKMQLYYLLLLQPLQTSVQFKLTVYMYCSVLLLK